VDTFDGAQLIAGSLTVIFALVLASVGRKDLVATRSKTYTDRAGTKRKVRRGQVIPRADQELAAEANVPTREVRRSVMGALVVGMDNRTSTSKAIATAWTFLIAWGLFSAIVALVLGADLTWPSLQEEYLLLLGGPFAAAILAKYATSGQAESKPDGEVGESSPAQLVTNDSGDADLGDFQYVVFSVIGIAYFLSQFIGELATGFPDLPPTLTGLMLTSTGGYAAKKLLAQQAPTLISVVPVSAIQGGTADVFGMNLTVPPSAPDDGGNASDDDGHASDDAGNASDDGGNASDDAGNASDDAGNASDDGEKATPIVLTGDAAAEVTTHAVVLGNDRLTIKIADAAPVGSAPITVTRADGVQARDAKGVGVLAFEVLKKPDEPADDDPSGSSRTRRRPGPKPR
jgi:hypothetical protein